MAYRNFEELINAVSQRGSDIRKRAAVAAPRTENVAAAVIKAASNGALDCVLFGNRAEIEGIFEKLGYNIDKQTEDSGKITIIEASSDQEAAALAVKAVRDGKCDLIMKGSLETGTLLKGVVNKETGIGLGGVMFHMMLVEIPTYHKIIGVTDGGMVISPTLEQKISMVGEAVKMFRRLDVSCPKVACLAAVEKVNEKMQETVDAAELKRLALDGAFGDCIVEGPISTDLAFSKAAAATKGFVSEVTGDVDIVLVPGIATGNIMVKSLVEFAGATTAGCILGAKVPISLTSRGASADEEYNALMLAAAQV